MKKILLLLLLLPLFSQAQIITTVAGCGIGDDSSAIKAELFQPMSMATDHAGNTYIVDQYSYRVRKIDASGVITTFAGNGKYSYTGDGGPAVNAGIGDIFSVAVDKTGNVYIADVSYDVIRKINTSGIISTIAGTGTSGYNGDGIAATAAKLHGASDIAIDTAGNIYIADRTNYRVRKINTSGIITTVAGNGTSGNSGFGGPATAAEIGTPFRIALDKKGNLYIGSYSGWYIFKVDTAGTLTTIAGTGTFGYSGDGGPATAATFSAPCGIAVDTAGNVYFSDISYSRVREINSATGIITTFAGTGTAGNSGDGGPATSAEIASPEDLNFDSSGNLYIADLDNNRIRKVSTGGAISTIAGQNGLFGEGYNALNAEISVPDNVAVDAAGNVYFPDYYNNRIREINAATGIITTVAGAGIAGYADGFSGDGGPATAAHVYNPAAVAFDAPGNMYIADAGNNRVRKVNTSGIITTVAGTGAQGYSGDNGPATAAEMYAPGGVAVDSSGNVYIVDGGNYRIRKINTSGIITTVAGTGTSGYSGDGFAATAAKILPYDVAADAAGNIYIADGGNNRIRKVNTSGIITTIAGTGTAGYTGDGGPATAAEVDGPGGVKVDGIGNVWISDGSNRARMIDTAGIIYSIAGNGTPGFSGDGGPATAAEINGPAGVAIDGSGNLYIADGSNYRIRKVSGVLGVPTINKATSWNVNVYPNPANTSLTISASVKITNINICNIVGQSVYKNQYNAQQAQIDISGLPVGIYFVKINGVMTKKFVKE